MKKEEEEGAKGRRKKNMRKREIEYNNKFENFLKIQNYSMVARVRTLITPGTEEENEIPGGKQGSSKVQDISCVLTWKIIVQYVCFVMTLDTLVTLPL